MDNIAEAHMRKLNGLALCLLLPTNDPQLLQRTPHILSMTTSVLAATQNPFEYAHALLCSGALLTISI